MLSGSDLALGPAVSLNIGVSGIRRFTASFGPVRKEGTEQRRN
jgi:hypothetical protein